MGLIHYVKSVRIRSFSGPYFHAFRPNTERYCRKVGTRKTSNTDTFHAGILYHIYPSSPDTTSLYMQFFFNI